MSFREKIRRCNDRNLAQHLPFLIGGERFGFISPARADILARFPKVFEVQAHHLQFNQSLVTPEQRTAAIENIAPELVATGAFLKLKGEAYSVKNAWHDTEQLRIDRALVVGFGFRAYGVHINGFVRKAVGLHLWIGTRSLSCSVEPGKLDNMVAGGQPAGLGLMANVIKECDEEAGLSADQASRAQPVGHLSYCFDTPQGVRVDTLFCYDLEMPEGVVPKNRDDEISNFQLMHIEDVLALVRDTNTFKFNVNLVILDFAIRHGVIAPETEPGYEKLIFELRQTPL